MSPPITMPPGVKQGQKNPLTMVVQKNKNSNQPTYANEPGIEKQKKCFEQLTQLGTEKRKQQSTNLCK